jgi:hypothetical protein
MAAKLKNLLTFGAYSSPPPPSLLPSLPKLINNLQAEIIWCCPNAVHGINES